MRRVMAVLGLDEDFRQLGMAQRLAGTVVKQVLLRHIGDVFRLFVLREKMIEGLVLGGPRSFRNRLIPFLCVVEFRVHVKNHAPERQQAVADDLTYRKLSRLYVLHFSSASIFSPCFNLRWLLRIPHAAAEREKVRKSRFPDTCPRA